VPTTTATPLPHPANLATWKVRRLGLQDYQTTWRAMQDFTAQRNAATTDELWFVEHPAVFTLGLNGKPEHVLASSEIPVIKVDRGGQVTYHGPGQLVTYVLLNVASRHLSVRQLVQRLEQAVIDLLGEFNVVATARREAPGVYVRQRKVAALGLRIRKGCSYHGLALNVAMDLSPFSLINPCGYRGMEVTQLRDLGIDLSVAAVSERLESHLNEVMGYTGAASAANP
jgi:lipoyl(octanoyl) transferase